MHMKRLAAASALLLSLLASAPALAIDNGAYSHDADNGYRNPRWLTALPDSRRLSELSLPGTHDTMAFYGGDIAQTQTMPLTTQLQAGVRVLDIRLRHYYNSLLLHHGPIYQYANFDDVLATASQFLRENPGETVLMRVQQEYDPVGNTREFWQSFQAYSQNYPGLFWAYDSSNPTLGRVRGKVVLLQNFGAPQRLGLDYGSLNAQDNYVLKSNWDLYRKWTEVKQHMANASAGDRNAFYINYLSGSTGSFPYFVASGQSSPQTHAPQLATGLTTPGFASSYPDFPRVSCFIGICTIAFAGTNKLASERLASGAYQRVGILMVDFPGGSLLRNIINLNPR